MQALGSRPTRPRCSSCPTTRCCRCTGRPTGSGWPAAVATGGGVRTQVWVVRPDGTRRPPGRRLGRRSTPRSDRGCATATGWSSRYRRRHPDALEPLRHRRPGHRRPRPAGPRRPDRRAGPVGRRPVRAAARRPAGRRTSASWSTGSPTSTTPLLPYPDTGSTDVGLLRPAPPGDDDAVDGLPGHRRRPAAPRAVAAPSAPTARAGPRACSPPATTPNSRSSTPTRTGACWCWSGTWPGAARSSCSTRPPAHRRPVPTLPGRRRVGLRDVARRALRGGLRRRAEPAAIAVAPGHRRRDLVGASASCGFRPSQADGQADAGDARVPRRAGAHRLAVPPAGPRRPRLRRC